MFPMLRQRYFVSKLSTGKVDVTDDDLAAINGMTKNGPLKPLTKEEIYVRRMYILGEEPTTKLSIHPEGKAAIGGGAVNTLSDLAATIVGGPMLEGHRIDKSGWGRIFRAEVLSNVSGYDGKVLKIDYYFLVADDGVRRAARIDGGIDAEGSISYRFKSAHCSICGKQISIGSFLGQVFKTMNCTHKLGQDYDGEVCYWYPIGVIGAEVSMVYRGAYPRSRSLLSDDGIPATREQLFALYADETADAAYEMALSDAIINAFKGAGNGTGTGGEGGTTGNTPLSPGGEAGNYGEGLGDAGGVVVTNWDAMVKACVEPIKPLKSGLQNNEFFELAAFKNLTGKHIVEPKYDGVGMWLVKRKGKVKLYTDSMAEHAKKFPGCVADAEKMAVDDFILPGEMVKYIGKKRGTHSDVTAYLASKGPYEDYHFKFKPFDVAVIGGKDVRNVDLIARRNAMKAIKSSSHIHPTKYLTVDGGAAVVKAIEQVATREGAMVKAAEMKLTKVGRKHILKWKRQNEVDAKVKAVSEKGSGSYVYTCVVGAETGSSYIEIGETYVTKVKANVGDIITVSVDKVTYDAKKKTFTWYAPKVIAVRPDKKRPDPASVLKRIAEKKETKSRLSSCSLFEIVGKLDNKLDFDVYVCGGMATVGRSDHDIDLLTDAELGADDRRAVLDLLGADLEPYVDFVVNAGGPSGLHVKIPGRESYADGAKKYAKRFVLQRHSWGKASHYDLRFGNPDGTKMWGFTCFKEPSKVAGGPKVRCEEKDYHDVKWLGFNGKIKPGEPGNPTKNLIATMEILDKGKYDFIKRESDFLEVVLHGSTWKGRYVFRKISVKESKNVAGDESKGKGTFWVLWKPLEQTPHKPVKNIGLCEQADGSVIFWEI